MKIGTSKIESLMIFPLIKQCYLRYADNLKSGKMTPAELFSEKIITLLPEGHNITVKDFQRWVKKQNLVTVTSSDSLMEKETEKQKQQIIIRQDVTQLMTDFIHSLKALALDPEALKASKVDIKDLYKIIREEEDRAKVVELKRRAEDRADYQFAFFVSMARAGQLKDEDIEFLESNIKQELIALKNVNGIYQLPGDQQLEEVKVAAETTVAQPSQGN